MTTSGGSRSSHVLRRAAWAVAVALAAFALIGGADGAFRGDLGVPATQGRDDTDSSRHLTHVTLATVRAAPAVSRASNPILHAGFNPSGVVPPGDLFASLIVIALVLRSCVHRTLGASRAPPALIA